MAPNIAFEIGLACTMLLLQSQSLPPGATPGPISAPEVQELSAGRVVGIVVNANTSNPVKKARLTLRPVSEVDNRRYVAVSDDAGRFAIDHVGSGQFRLAVERNGFITQEYGAKGVRRQGATLTVAPGQVLKHVDFRLIPHCVITGRVLDEDGEPMPYIYVQAMAYSYSQGKRDLRPVNSASTDDLGEYRLYGLAPGTYYLSATRQDRRWFGSAPPPSAKLEEGYAPTYYPNSLRLDAASPLQLASGAQLQGIDLLLLKTPVFRIRGRVISGSTGKPVRAGMLMLVPKNSKSFWMDAKRTLLRDPDGNFELAGVVPGAYNLIAQAVSDRTPEFARMALQVENTNIEKLEVVTGTGSDIRGAVRVDGGGTLKDFASSILLQPENGIPWGQEGATVAEDGSFRLQHVHPESYTVSVVGLPDDYYLKSVRIGQTNCANGKLDLSQNLPSGDLTITVSAAGGQVQGTVQNGKAAPAMGALVVLVPEAAKRGQSELFKSATTDQTGHYEMKGITPGAYKLFAWENVEAGRSEDPGFLKQYEGQGEIINFRENTREQRTLKLIPLDAPEEHNPTK